MRILDVIEADPHRLLLFAKSMPEAKCPERLREAVRLHTTDDCKLHLTARKVKRRFRKAIQLCVEDEGVCDVQLWVAMRFVATTWVGDTTELEGVMSLLK